MSRVTIKNGAVLKCDMPKCPNTFVTYSIVGKARTHPAPAGWDRINGKKVQDPDGHILSTKLVDLCPQHKPKPRVMEQSKDVAR